MSSVQEVGQTYLLFALAPAAPLQSVQELQTIPTPMQALHRPHARRPVRRRGQSLHDQGQS